MAVVGDRGLLTTARIRHDVVPSGLDWISALRTSDIRKLLSGSGQDAPSLDPASLVPDAVAEITGGEFPGGRLLVCLNPRLQEERRREREALLAATEAALAGIAAGAGRKAASRDRVNWRIGRPAGRWKILKHFSIEFGGNRMSFARNQGSIDAEAELDGIYIIRTSLDEGAIDAEGAVAAYKSLSLVERALRVIKSSGLEVRPVYVYTAVRVRAHVFFCMCQYRFKFPQMCRLKIPHPWRLATSQFMRRFGSPFLDVPASFSAAVAA